jgi:hypothetical protein
VTVHWNWGRGSIPTCPCVTAPMTEPCWHARARQSHLMRSLTPSATGHMARIRFHSAWDGPFEPLMATPRAMAQDHRVRNTTTASSNYACTHAHTHTHTHGDINTPSYQHTQVPSHVMTILAKTLHYRVNSYSYTPIINSAAHCSLLSRS